MCWKRQYVAFLMNLVLNQAKDIQACYRIKSNRIIMKFNNRNDCLQVLRAKKRLKDLNCITFNLPRDTKIFINESLCNYYKGLQKKHKHLKADNKIHLFYTNNEIIHLNLAENGSIKTITHINHPKNLFPNIDVDNLYLCLIQGNFTFQKIFAKLKLSPVLFKKIPSFVCLVFKNENI